MRRLLALALTVFVLTAAGPRTDGVWLPSKLAQKAERGTASELDLAQGVVFSSSDVWVGYGNEDETRTWRSSASGLEVRSGEDWRKLEWKPVRDGVVKTDIKQAGTLEELTFVPKTLQLLKAEKNEKLVYALLMKTAGSWVSGAHVLELGAATRLDGKAVAMRATPCDLHCEGKTSLPCAEVGELGDSQLFLLQGKKLVQVSVEGLCGSTGTGVELVEGGLVFDRRTEGR